MRVRHLLATALLAGAVPALAQDLNVVTGVTVRDEGKNVVVTVVGTRPPNFTTFSMADPPRFVIDFSEAKFKGVPEDMPVNDGTILVVKNLSYGAEQTSIARVMIAFSVDVDPPDVQAQGGTLVVTVAKPAGGAAEAPLVAAQRAADQARAEAQARAAAEKAEAERQEQQRLAAEEKAKAELAQLEKEQAEAQAQLAQAQPGAAGAAGAAGASGGAAAGGEAAAAAAATAGVAAAAAGQDDAERQREERRKEFERKKQEAAERKAQADRERQEAIAAKRAEDERLKREAAEAKAEAKRQREEALAAARADADRKRQEAAAAKAEAKRQRDEARSAARAEADRKKLEVALQRSGAMRAGGSLAVVAQVREVGFKQLPGASRVFLRTSAPPRFNIQDVGENLVRIEIENARVARRNDMRFLDTSFFPSAVAMVTPSRRGSTYVLDIKLKQKVPYQQKVEGDMLAIDFERPGGAGAAGSAPEPAATEAPEAAPAAEGNAPAPAEPGAQAR